MSCTRSEAALRLIAAYTNRVIDDPDLYVISPRAVFQSLISVGRVTRAVAMRHVAYEGVRRLGAAGARLFGCSQIKSFSVMQHQTCILRPFHRLDFFSSASSLAVSCCYPTRKRKSPGGWTGASIS
jgi:hypothetical protein